MILVVEADGEHLAGRGDGRAGPHRTDLAIGHLVDAAFRQAMEFVTAGHPCHRIGHGVIAGEATEVEVAAAELDRCSTGDVDQAEHSALRSVVIV